MTIRKPLCPICHRPANGVVRIGIRENPNTLVYSCVCGLEFIEPPFDDPKQYYSHEYRKEHNPVPWSEMTAKQRYDYYRPLMHKRLAHFQKHVPARSTVLEVGCSAGHYLDVLHGAGYNADGCDYNPDDVKYVTSELDYVAWEGGLEETGNARYDCICAYHVLEHVVDPVSWVNLAYDHLNPGGILYVQVPNLDDALLTLYDIPEFAERWYREPHLTYFNQHVLKDLLASAGFEVAIDFDQLYSFGNHMWWNMRREPMPDPATAQEPWIPPYEDESPIGTTRILSKWLQHTDQFYRDALIDLGMSDLLIGVGKKVS